MTLIYLCISNSGCIRQLMVKWGIWYIHECFLVWIILSTYLSHGSNNWVYTTGFAYSYIQHIGWMLHYSFVLALIPFIVYCSLPAFLTWIRYPLIFMYACVVCAHHLASFYVLVGLLFRQSSTCMFGFRSLDLGEVSVADFSAQRKREDLMADPPNLSLLADS